MAQPDTPAFSVRVGDRYPPSGMSTPIAYDLARSSSQAHSDWAPHNYKPRPVEGSRAELGRTPRAVQGAMSRDTTVSSLQQPIREVESQETESSDEDAPQTDTIRLWPLQICFRLAQFLFSLVSFSLVCALQKASHNVALEVRPFAYLLAMSLVSWVYSFCVTIFLICTPRWSKFPDFIERTQKIFMHVDFVLLLLLFSAASTTASVFPLYCYIGSKARHAMFHGGPTPSDICDNIFESALFGIMASFSFVAQFWFLVTPFIWRKR